MFKIGLTDTMEDVMVKMSEGNPGGLASIMSLVTEAQNINPGCMPNGFDYILYLDSIGVYGTDIYILWSDQCNRDTEKFMMLLDAARTGIISDKKLVSIAKDQLGRELFSEEEMNAIIDDVKEKIPYKEQAE
jgi:hypothetical protein